MPIGGMFPRHSDTCKCECEPQIIYRDRKCPEPEVCTLKQPSADNQTRLDAEIQRLRDEANELGKILQQVITGASNQEEIVKKMSSRYLCSGFCTYEVEYQDSDTLKQRLDLVRSSNLVQRIVKLRADLGGLTFSFGQDLRVADIQKRSGQLYEDILENDIMGAVVLADFSRDLELECDDKWFGKCSLADIFSTGTRLYLNAD